MNFVRSLVRRTRPARRRALIGLKQIGKGLWYVLRMLGKGSWYVARILSKAIRFVLMCLLSVVAYILYLGPRDLFIYIWHKTPSAVGSLLAGAALLATGQFVARHAWRAMMINLHLPNKTTLVIVVLVFIVLVTIMMIALAGFGIVLVFRGAVLTVRNIKNAIRDATRSYKQPIPRRPINPDAHEHDYHDGYNKHHRPPNAGQPHQDPYARPARSSGHRPHSDPHDHDDPAVI